MVANDKERVVGHFITEMIEISLFDTVATHEFRAALKAWCMKHTVGPYTQYIPILKDLLSAQHVEFEKNRNGYLWRGIKLKIRPNASAWST